ncbi:carboxymuconolactone decarboxylase family protein [Streptomyces zagrosensis]|uniref:AhpD family alkylhydroperoxidase n=1 Tax=Streptomyces zagrosensis TaxID=1042984 RepID=A0A7W9Q6Q2_9ACTN|nr:carboxymuconolactone decarboxylase family protein [Streptomyces zagrosensis]MBB5934639.1 AhpD family alkylhydroperoxidase [Streptomyces zagrosensis]
MTTEPTARLDLATAAPKVAKAMAELTAAAKEGLDPTLAELVQIRASQLNHCAYCLLMHTRQARKRGESEERLNLVSAWQEAATFFTAQEQAALALTEAVTLLPNGVSNEVYARAAEHFDEAELAHLIGVIFTINAWNRIAVSTGKVPGEE